MTGQLAWGQSVAAVPSPTYVREAENMKPVHSCIRILIALSLLLCLPATASGAEAAAAASAEPPTATVPVTIATDTTLTSDRIWLAPNPVKVNSGVTLTIQPGTTVKFGSEAFLMIEGTLVADGVGGNPIILTSSAEEPEPGAWGGAWGFNPASIAFTVGSEPAVYDTNGEYVSGSIVRNAVLEYGLGISCLGSAPLIEGNHIRYTGTNSAGALAALVDLGAGPGAPAPVMRGNNITDNQILPALLALPGTVFSGNVLVRNEGGVYASGDVRILGNLITETRDSSILYGHAGSAAVRLDGGEFRGNAVYGNHTTYDLVYDAPAASPLDIAGNYWGTTSEEQIEARIYHGNDHFSVGLLTYTPFLTEPPTDVPAFLSSVTVGSGGPVGLGAATFTLRFSSPIDQTVAPRVSFYPARRGTWSQYTRQDSGLPSNTITALAEGQDGSIWIGTGGTGAAQFDGTTWAYYNAATSGLGDNRVESITTTPTGEVWFGLSGQSGIVASRYDGSNWKAYSGVECEDLDPDLARMGYTYGDPEPVEWLCNAYSIAADAAGSVWFAGYGVVRYDGSAWHLHDFSNSELPPEWVTAVATGPDGTVWAVIDDKGVAQFDGTRWTLYDQANSALPDTFILDVAVAPDGVVWFGSYSGPTRFDGTDWTYFPGDTSYAPDGPPYFPTRFAFGPDNTLWVTSDSGLVSYDGNVWTYYRPPAYGSIGAILADRHGNVWVGVAQGGLAVLWGGQDYLVSEGGRWLDDRTWQATYPITSLLQRGEYAVSVSGAKSLNGMTIQPDSRFTFSVDYPSTITDTTPPPVPNLYASGVLGDPSGVYARWSAADRESAITAYRYAIGSSQGASDIVGWTETADTSLSLTGLGLLDGHRYWLAVQARNAGGLWSELAHMTLVAGQISPGNVYLPVANK